MFSAVLTDVTGDKRDDELLRLGALRARLRHDVLVDRLDGALEAGELHHRVGDLSPPQWHDALVEAEHTTEVCRTVDGE